MIFKDRKEAGEKLLEAIKNDKKLISKIDNVVVVSLLRGGIIVGNFIAKKLKVVHLPLVVAKIPAPPPHSPELAVGAICQDFVYQDQRILDLIYAKDTEVDKQIKKAKAKQKKYLKKFNLNRVNYAKHFKNKIVILTDDGVATGSTIQAAVRFIKTKKPKELILAVPVAPSEFDTKPFDKSIILHKDPMFYAVGQYFREFAEVTDRKVKEIIKTERHF